MLVPLSDVEIQFKILIQSVTKHLSCYTALCGYIQGVAGGMFLRIF